MADKQDSNLTGLRIAEEKSLKVLPGTDGEDAIWYPAEPNEYSDFGGELTTLARNPINPSRQRKKGAVTDLDASGGFTQDLTLNNSTRYLQGFLFADLREKPTTAPIHTAAGQVDMGAVTASTKTYAGASGLAVFTAGMLVMASGYNATANNGLKRVVSSTATTVVVNETLVDEAASSAPAVLQVVGYQFASADASLTLNGNLTRLESAAVDMTTLGLIPGEWIYVGGDGVNFAFSETVYGLARISAITADYLEFDKIDWTRAAMAGTGKTLQIFYGSVLKNEQGDLIKRRTWQLERTLGKDADGTMSEYLVGAVANELTMNMEQADKVTLEMSFVALDNEQRTGAEGLKAGARPGLQSDSMINTSSNVSRIKLSLVDVTTDTVLPLFGYATSLSLTINNGVTPNKAIGVLGGFDTSAGTFEVGGEIEAYFSDINAVRAVRNNADVTLDYFMNADNGGILVDIPLLTLGGGRLNVEQDQPIMVPLENNAAESKFGNTLLMMFFPYVPNRAR